MIYIVLNAVPILIATLAGLAFGIAWHRLTRQRRAPTAWSILAIAFVAEFWFASILAGALILAPSKAGAWTMALGSSVVIWIGFIVPVLIVTQLYRGLRMRAALGDCAHWLGVMIVQAIMLKTIGLVPPPM